MVQPHGKEIIVASQDVIGLYPNLDIVQSAEAVQEAVEESTVEFLGVDMDWVGKVIAMASNKQEIEQWGMEDMVPIRKYKGGVRPGLTSGELFVSKAE